MAKQYSSPPAMSIDTNKTYVATFDTSKGKIVVDLFPKEAPKTVNNFVFLARDKFYDGTKFHRVIRDFMIQGGCPNTKDDSKQDQWGSGGPGYTINLEASDLRHLRGTLSMARTNDPNSAGSGFFIMHKDNPGLDTQYSAFGNLEEGMAEDLPADYVIMARTYNNAVEALRATLTDVRLVTEEITGGTGSFSGATGSFSVDGLARPDGACLQRIAGDGTGDTRWKVPGVLDWSTMTHNPFVDVSKDSTTLYASDRDVFLFHSNCFTRTALPSVVTVTFPVAVTWIESPSTSSRSALI